MDAVVVSVDVAEEELSYLAADALAEAVSVAVFVAEEKEQIRCWCEWTTSPQASNRAAAGVVSWKSAAIETFVPVAVAVAAVVGR